jgi:hypothetical protein
LCIFLKKEKFYVINRPVCQLYEAAMPLPIDCGVPTTKQPYSPIKLWKHIFLMLSFNCVGFSAVPIA